MEELKLFLSALEELEQLQKGHFFIMTKTISDIKYPVVKHVSLRILSNKSGRELVSIEKTITMNTKADLDKCYREIQKEAIKQLLIKYKR